MAIERLTVGALIDLLRQHPVDLPVVVPSYEEGYDPVTNLKIISVARTQNREWYVGMYEDAPEKEQVVLISSKYHKVDIAES